MSTKSHSGPLGTFSAQLTFAWTLIFLILALGAVSGRLYSRFLKRANLGLDDLLIVAAFVAFTAQGVLVFISVFDGGVGHHLNEFPSPESKLIVLLKMVTAIQYPYGVTMGLIRCSICVLILRVFRLAAGKAFTYLAYGALLVAVAQALYVIFDASFICKPFAANWNKKLLETKRGAKCGNNTSSYIAVVGWGIACDVYIFFLPIPEVLKLVMARRQRIMLCCVFGLGIADIIVAAFRLRAVKQSAFHDPNAITLSVVDGIIWGMAEPSIAILVACGPILWPLVDRSVLIHFKSLASSLASSVKSIKQKFKSPLPHDSFGQFGDQLELVAESHEEPKG